MTRWIYVWDSLPFTDAKIDGVSFNDPMWKRVPGEYAQVRDPIYGDERTYPVYAFAKPNGTVIRTAMSEHTPGVYLAYVDDPALAAKVVPKPTREVRFR